ncbi:putative D-inositol 3-phosphate glycosyltransferase [Streptomyces afghaniensis 772]|uniref:Putative D-inositol 3-phosphate glycosyltransferase n=1 Tax=Streptomyces afghaniensis 772 TaxID=1283301 RepID=S4MWZ4_9ACTN|nr:putative D-inositol 3-phosphate glycosyltransferase [Streptomyces afghaniensis 772]
MLVPTPAERAELARVLGPHRVSLLRRGIDHQRFRPDPGARPLGREYGVPADRPPVLFAGRLDATKGVPLLTESVRLLRERGRAVHLVLAGAGAEAGPVRRALGADVSLLGPLPLDRPARVYAGCDVFAFPSRTETCGNVVAEAMASGLAVVLPEGARTAQWLTAPGRDGIVVRHDDPGEWADALGALVDRPRLLSAVPPRDHHGPRHPPHLGPCPDGGPPPRLAATRTVSAEGEHAGGVRIRQPGGVGCRCAHPASARNPSRIRCSRADSGTAKTSSATISGCTRLRGPYASAGDWKP